MSVDPVDPKSTRAEVIVEAQPKVNKKKQISPSKRWCATWNNYPEDAMHLITRCLRSEDHYIVGKEVGESGTPHLQMYFEFYTRTRPKSRFVEYKEIHWIKARGTRKENLAYCMKDSRYDTNFKMDKELKVINIENFYPWQKYVWDQLSFDPEDRKITWIYERIGNTGKSALAKLSAHKLNCLVVGGKANDIFCGIQKYHENNGYYPEVIIVDCPRDNQKHFNYAAIEQVKNGLCFSGKYESSMLVFNSPHIIVFANDLPNFDKFSVDRWRILWINEKKELESMLDEN